MAFEHLKRLDIKERTAWCELPEVSPHAAVLVRPATDANGRYFNEFLKRAGTLSRLIARGANLSADQVARLRRIRRDIYPDLVFAGDWRGIEDDKGKEVKCTNEMRREFVEAIPDHIFDRIQDFCERPESFLSNGEAPMPDAQDIAGNSGSGSSGS